MRKDGEKEDWPPMSVRPPKAPPSPPRNPLDEQFRTLDDPPPPVHYGGLPGEPLPSGLLNAVHVSDPRDYSIMTGRWMLRISDSPTRWQRFWARFLLGWHWERFR